MTNPWLEIPLADYEGHMSLPTVAQARLLADVFEQALRTHAPESVMVVGCAGGNGFDRIEPAVTKRVVGIDINPDYIEAARSRFEKHLPGVEWVVADVESDGFRVEPVELVFAGLLFEYVEIDRTLATIRRSLGPRGVLVAVLQLPSDTCPEVTPSPFASLQQLASCMNLVSPEFLASRATAQGFTLVETRRVTTHSKAFAVLTFVLSPCPVPGVVVAVCRGGSHSFSKPTVDEIQLIAGEGIAGDAHRGVTVKHRSRVAADPTQPNLRQVHLLHSELLDELQAAGFRVSPGVIGENITTRGIDLLALPVGTLLHLGKHTIVEVTGLRNPCSQLDAYQPGLQAAVLERDVHGQLIRKAGIMGVVRVGGMVRAGDIIRCELPCHPHRPLDRV